MKYRTVKMALLLGVAALAGQESYSDTTTTGVSSTTRKSVYERISEKFALTYFGTYSGASLKNLAHSVQPNIDGTPDYASPQSLDSLITVGYKFNKNLMMGAVGRFLYFPVGNPVGTGHAVQELDPAFTIMLNNVVNQNGFKLGLRFNANVPVSPFDYLAPRHLATALTPTAIMNYDVPNTSLSVGLFSFVRGYIPTSGSPDNVRTYKLYFGPNASYQLSKTLAATLWIDIEFNRNRGSSFFAANAAPIDIQPGINWDVTKNISVNPVLNIYPSNPTLAATSLRAYIVARAF